MDIDEKKEIEEAYFNAIRDHIGKDSQAFRTGSIMLSEAITEFAGFIKNQKSIN